MQPIMVQPPGKKKTRDKDNRKNQLLYSLLEYKELDIDTLAEKLDVTSTSVYGYSRELEAEDLIIHKKNGIIILGPNAEEYFKKELEKMEPVEKILLKRITLIKNYYNN